MFDLHATQMQRKRSKRPGTHAQTAVNGRVSNFSSYSSRRRTGTNRSGAGECDPRKYSHDAAVTGIHATANGLHYVTAGADHRVRLWDSMYHHNLLIHYPDTYNEGNRPRRICATEDGRYLFHPSRETVQVWLAGCRCNLPTE